MKRPHTAALLRAASSRILLVVVLAPALTVLPQQTSLPDIGPAPSARSPASLADARHLMNAERFSEAETALRIVLAGDPDSAPARYLLAYALLRENKPEDALAEYTRAAALQPPSPEDLKNVGQAYVLLDDFADAATWIGRAVRMTPTDPEIWYALGRLRYSEQKYSEAAECFQKALLLAPQNVKAENNLGLAYEGLGRPDDAIAAYRQAIAWQDATPPKRLSEQPLLNLAVALLHRGDLVEARPLLTRAVAIAPEDARVREQLGHLYLQQADYAQAARQLEAATRLDPGRSDLHFLLGQAYRHLGWTSKAKEQFDLTSRLQDHVTQPFKK